MLEIPSEKSKMRSAELYASEVRSWVAEAADGRHGRRKRVLADIAREVGLHVRRVSAYFYGEVRSPSAAEYEQFKQWREDELRRLARERIQLGVRLQWIEARLNAREAGEYGAHEAMAGPQVGAGVHLDGEATAQRRGLAGGEGVIPDPRQMALGRGW